MGINIDNKKLYTVKEVAEILNLQTGSIYDYIKSGMLHAQKIGGVSPKHQWRIKDNDLQEFIDGKKNNKAVN